MTTLKYNRRKFLQSSIYGLGTISTLGLQGCDYLSTKTIQPNILIVVSDDQRWDSMGCAGNSIIHTPNMDALAAKGSRFTNAFVTSPICCASRASIFTGLYERSHRHNFGTPPLDKRHVEMSYPSLLRNAGYQTGFVGKFGVFTDPANKDIGKMFDSFEPLDRTPYFKKEGGREKHLTDITTDEAIRFLESNRGTDPFCLSVSYNAPHAEDFDEGQFFWPPDTDHLYRNLQIPQPGNIARTTYNNSPEFLKNSLARIRWRWRFDSPEKYQRMVKGYYRMISGVDNGLGRIRAKLDTLKLSENTIVIFLSDNGYFLGERGFAGKWFMYEPSIRIPLIVYDPRISDNGKGKLIKNMALNVDIAPTILDYSGIEIPGSMQGRSLSGLLNGEVSQWRSEVFCEHLYEHDEIPKSEMVRTNNLKYIRYPENSNYEELYNHKLDPLEMTNLVADEKLNDHLVSLRKRCDSYIESLTQG